MQDLHRRPAWWCQQVKHQQILLKTFAMISPFLFFEEYVSQSFKSNIQVRTSPINSEMTRWPIQPVPLSFSESWDSSSSLARPRVLKCRFQPSMLHCQTSSLNFHLVISAMNYHHPPSNQRLSSAFRLSSQPNNQRSTNQPTTLAVDHPSVRPTNFTAAKLQSL